MHDTGYQVKKLGFSGIYVSHLGFPDGVEELNGADPRFRDGENGSRARLFQDCRGAPGGVQKRSPLTAARARSGK